MSCISAFQHHISGFSCWGWVFLLGKLDWLQNWWSQDCIWFPCIYPQGKEEQPLEKISILRLHHILILMFQQIAFYNQWFELYPEFLSNPFYIAGESYAGVYVPTLAYEVVKGIISNLVPYVWLFKSLTKNIRERKQRGKNIKINKN